MDILEKLGKLRYLFMTLEDLADPGRMERPSDDSIPKGMVGTHFLRRIKKYFPLYRNSLIEQPSRGE